MSYQPNTLSQQFTVDVLYGAAIYPWLSQATRPISNQSTAIE